MTRACHRYVRLEERYARITARDLVAASGTNLASIGYHFGSKEALLTQAMLELSSDLGDEYVRAASASAGTDPAARLEALLTEMAGLMTTHRSLWAASVEALSQAEHLPEVRAQLAAGFEEARPALAAAVLDTDESKVDERTAQRLGSLVYALTAGLMMQHLVDPEHAPSGHDLAEALRMLGGPTPSEEEDVPGGG